MFSQSIFVKSLNLGVCRYLKIVDEQGMNSLNIIRRVGKNFDEGQLASLGMSVHLSLCVSILNNSAANGRVFMIYDSSNIPR
jgi:hypothetical protein